MSPYLCTEKQYTGYTLGQAKEWVSHLCTMLDWSSRQKDKTEFKDCGVFSSVIPMILDYERSVMSGIGRQISGSQKRNWLVRTSVKVRGFPGGLADKESACNAGDLGLIPGLGSSPGEGNGYPLQYSGLENSVDCIVHGVAESWTWLSDFHFHFCSSEMESDVDMCGFFCCEPGLWIVLTDPATFDNIAGNFQGKVDTRLQALSSVQCTFYLLPVFRADRPLRVPSS